ncbi:glycoside hydrolase family 38 C-terminal domain-containing protein [Liquorilactobacillus sicerae]|uniref:glycoside hydrolase family 38 N-terminal domain-containing protein n=1 Tax=Liquorilactobacillus sicerae TaxID=1416943 RepID=UPI002481541E|nr:glycoside hydrolase family 38 C-terminal domain-containing protein [Liquorilactobacillus sicerae]
MKKTTVHIVPHTHWDREWYFQNTRATVYLISQINEVVEVLKKHPQTYFYLFDAQSSLLEDYLNFYPQKKEVLSKLIKDRRLLFGPWYTQTDQLAISQESIVRNLYYGIDYAQKMGHSMKIGYCPDIFGQGGNMPEIYQSFGIKQIIFWRGIGQSKLAKSEFEWLGDDGTKITALQIPFGYFYGANIPTNSKDLQSFINSMIPKLENRSNFTDLYLPNGFDQLPINHNLDQIVDKLNELDNSRVYQISSPEIYMEALAEDIVKGKKDLPKIQGELIDGEDSRVHKSIYSTRADLKQANNRLENYLVNVVEPLVTLGYSLGLRYPHAELEFIWKELLKNAAHDSIGNCNSDSTNFDIKARNKVAADMAHNLLEKTMRDISNNISPKDPYSFTVFNSLPYSRTTVLDANVYLPDGAFKFIDSDGNEIDYEILSQQDQSDYVLHQAELLTPTMYRVQKKDPWMPKQVFYSHVRFLIKDVPGLGYRQFYLIPSQQNGLSRPEISADQEIENDFYTISLNRKNNTFTVKDNQSKQVYHNQFCLEDNGDAGDSYNYSPPQTDWQITSKDAKLIKIKSQKGKISETLTISLEFILPQDLIARQQRSATRKMIIDLSVILKKSDPVIQVSVKINNPVSDHRLRLILKTGIQASHSIADSLFGVVKRPVIDQNAKGWKEKGWVEKPTEINPLQNLAAVSDENKTVAGFTDGPREYEVIGKDFDQLAFTIFRANSWMGKTDLRYRPGRASGETIVLTPDAKLLGQLKFEFGFCYRSKSFDQDEICKLAKEFYSSLQVYELAPFLNSRIRFIRNVPQKRRLPFKLGLLEIADSTAVVSTIKKAEASKEIILRCFNPFLNREAQINLPSDAIKVNLDETTVDCSTKKFNHNKFKTFKFALGGDQFAYIQQAY